MKHFFAGLLFVSLAIPIIDNVNTLIATGTEYLSMKMAQKTLKIKKDCEELMGEEEQGGQAFAVGFNTTDVEEDCCEEEYDD